MFKQLNKSWKQIPSSVLMCINRKFGLDYIFLQYYHNDMFVLIIMVSVMKGAQRAHACEQGGDQG